MFENCRSILQREILLVSPKIVIIMGDHTPLLDIIKENCNIFWQSIEHPMTLVEKPELKRPAWEALKLVRMKLNERCNLISGRQVLTVDSPG